MKKVILYSLLVLAANKFNAQVNADCINAIPLCSNPSFTFYATSGLGSTNDIPSGNTTSNPTTNPASNNSGCLLAQPNAELNPQWLLLTIGNAGFLEFVFGAANSQNPQVGCYDWAMWKYTPNTCSGILNNTLPPVRCNWNGTCGGGTGIASQAHYSAFGGNAADFEPPLQVNACEQYIICISNYSGVNTLVSFQSLGTASLSCSPNCNPNYSVCLGGSATIVPVNYLGLTNPTYSMQPGNLTSSTGSFVVSPTVTTTYTTYITGINGVNAVQTSTAASTVTVFAIPVTSPTVINASCTNTANSVNLNLSFNPPGSFPSYTVNWANIPNGASTYSTTSFSGGIAAGPYTATITTANGCTATTTFSVKPIPLPINLVVNPLGTTHSITCSSNVTLTAINPAYNYTWSSANAVFTSSSAVFTSTLAGNWLLYAVDPLTGCTASQTFAILHNTVIPVATINPTFQNITCNLTSVTTVSASANPSVNVTHQVLSPQGGTFSAQSHTMIYTPGGVGTYTHYVINDANGCTTMHMFTVTSNQGFPTYNVTSPDNFTLGCSTESVATINIVNANTTPVGGAVSYTLIGPPTSIITPTGVLGGSSSYTVNVPGTWTVITKDNVSFCETRTPISILNNTFTPDISAVVPRQILDCYVPKITLKGKSITSNVGYLWSFPKTPGTLQSDTILIEADFLSASNTSIIANYTLTVTDNNNTCKSTTIVPMYQNLYPPKAGISKSIPAITCKTATLILTNQSSTGIPPTSGLPYTQPVVAYIWEGPTPQEPLQLSSTYTAGTTGIYTMTARDLNNGCTSTATTQILDNRVYPSVNKPLPPPPRVLDCGKDTAMISALITGSTAGFTYSWIAPPTVTISSASAPTIAVNKVGSYRVLVTNTVNGCASLGEVSVVNGSLNAAFEVQPSSGAAPLTVTMFNNSSSTLGPENITSYWSFSNNSNSVTTTSNLSPNTVYAMPGTYTITMFAVKGSCLDTAYKVVSVELPSFLEIPNVFTPNGDGTNDFFFLKATNLEEISIVIIDRWGHRVYDLTSTTGNIAWDGKNAAGKDVAEGTYFYIIKAKGKDTQSFEKKGTLSLFR